MSVLEEIDALPEKVRDIPQKTRRRKVYLYSQGLKSKIRQSQYALSELTTFSDQAEQITTTTAPEEFMIAEKVHFYCDAFWAFLYSSLDILAQIINQSLKLGMDEREVSFKKVASRLDKNTGLSKKIQACLSSKAFRNLERYRNCSMHRRAIYIEEEVRTVRGTTGYRSASSSVIQEVVRTICDNPLVATPKTSQNRLIPQYMEDTKESILKHVEDIVKNITFVR
jgi:cell fate (sporulation/competence/biofilm development) regulator YlbF (YheA/YmcA/DUF963 family)